MPDLAGRIIGERYRVEQIVARGGMATVYLAVDLRLERKVALKIIHPHLANDISFRDKFIREARIAAKLSHPNLVNVFDQGEDGDMAFMAMEFVSGITLRDALKDFGALDWKRALDLFEPMLSGLAAAHRAGIGGGVGAIGLAGAGPRGCGQGSRPAARRGGGCAGAVAGGGACGAVCPQSGRVSGAASA